MTLERPAFGLILGAFVLLASAYSVVVPLGEAPDEVSHFAYIQHLAIRRELPAGEGAALGEAKQPPLYYALGALATAWIPQAEFQFMANPDWSLDNAETPNLLLHTRAEAFPYQGAALAWHLARLLSILMGAITVWATWRIALGLLPDRPHIALAAAAFLALLPGFVYVSAAVNNDNLVVMFSALAVLQLVRLTKRSFSWTGSAVLGVLLGLALLAKLSGLVVWAFSAVILAVFVLQSGQWKKLGTRAAASIALAAAILLPSTVRNLQTTGDPLGWSRAVALTPVRDSFLTFAEWIAIGRGLFTSFWGRFGGALQIRLADAAYVLLAIITAAVIVGWLGYLVDWRRRRLAAEVRQVFLWFAAFWAVLLAAFAVWALAVQGTDQARQLFPGLPLLSIVFVLGLARLFPAVSGRALGVLFAAGFLASVTVLFYLGGLYSAPFQDARAAAALGGPNAPADFGKTIRVLDYRVSPAKVSPGGTIGVELHWQGLEPSSDTIWLLLQVAGTGEPIASREGVPANGRLTTDLWRTGQTFVSNHSLSLPPGSAPGTYRVRLGLHPFGRWTWLPVRGQDMLDLGEITVAAPP